MQSNGFGGNCRQRCCNYNLLNVCVVSSTSTSLIETLEWVKCAGQVVIVRQIRFSSYPGSLIRNLAAHLIWCWQITFPCHERERTIWKDFQSSHQKRPFRQSVAQGREAGPDMNSTLLPFFSFSFYHENVKTTTNKWCIARKKYSVWRRNHRISDSVECTIIKALVLSTWIINFHPYFLDYSI